MKEEELDWQIYHILAENPGKDEHSLAELLEVSVKEIQDSFSRLEKALLIEHSPEGTRVLSIPEMLLRCQERYDERCPFSFDGGIIRLKQEPRSTDD